MSLLLNKEVSTIQKCQMQNISRIYIKAGFLCDTLVIKWCIKITSACARLCILSFLMFLNYTVGLGKKIQVGNLKKYAGGVNTVIITFFC